MPRPTTPAYELGKITLRPHPTRPGQFQARGYFKDRRNIRREASAAGSSRTAATRALRAKVTAAERQHAGGTSELNNETRVDAAAQVWLTRKRSQRKRGGGALSPVTIADYEGYVSRVIEGSAIGSLTVSQVNSIAVIEHWLTEIANTRGTVAALQSRKVLGGILTLAERLDAIPASVMRRVELPVAAPGSAGDRSCRDPEDCDGNCGGRHLDTRRAFTIEEMRHVQRAADASGADIGDLVAFLFGTGARISEALRNTAWVDIDLDARRVRVRGTKTRQADRVLALSESLTERLRLRASRFGTEGQVFGTTRFSISRNGANILGKPRDRQNVLKAIRTVLSEADARWAGSHSFRRTVASWMDQAGAPLAEIGAQLGHSDLNVTAHYLGRTTTPTRAATVMVLPAAGASESGE
ncbi:tyrosine-type recombinase/integrase [Nocardioides sp. Soil774]|uniref:tyrosine-type recombinase/integrase n=1 Tax=Nocardioides sp. Soil774 TaxID=1736408 RepID=UPI000A90D4F0|nr:tyrosine-type recombinase/integrase [Nocardioides sp. Soil774]